MALNFEHPAALAFPAVSRLLPGWRVPACALRYGSNPRRSADLSQRSAMGVILGIGSLRLPEVGALHSRMAAISGDRRSAREGEPAWSARSLPRFSDFGRIAISAAGEQDLEGWFSLRSRRLRFLSL
jgi:hypothetical protein